MPLCLSLPDTIDPRKWGGRSQECPLFGNYLYLALILSGEGPLLSVARLLHFLASPHSCQHFKAPFVPPLLLCHHSSTHL